MKPQKRQVGKVWMSERPKRPLPIRNCSPRASGGKKIKDAADKEEAKRRAVEKQAREERAWNRLTPTKSLVMSNSSSRHNNNNTHHKKKKVAKHHTYNNNDTSVQASTINNDNNKEAPNMGSTKAKKINGGEGGKQIEKPKDSGTPSMTTTTTLPSKVNKRKSGSPPTRIREEQKYSDDDDDDDSESDKPPLQKKEAKSSKPGSPSTTEDEETPPLKRRKLLRTEVTMPSAPNLNKDNGDSSSNNNNDNNEPNNKKNATLLDAAKRMKKDNNKNRQEAGGVGVNRIRIEPLMEEREQGSASQQVVTRLLKLYDKSNPEVSHLKLDIPKDILDPFAISVEPPPTTTTAETVVSQDNEKVAAVATAPKDDEELLKPVEANPSAATTKPGRSVLVHDVPFPENYSLRKHRSPNEKIAKPITISDVEDGKVPKALSHLPPDSKIEILSRRSGKFFSGSTAVRVQDLVPLLKKHSGIEPLIPPTNGNAVVQEARSSTMVTVSAKVKRQPPPKPQFRKGELVLVKHGPHKGRTGAFERVLPGGWASFRSLVGGMLLVLVPLDSLTPHQEEKVTETANQVVVEEMPSVAKLSDLQRTFLGPTTVPAHLKGSKQQQAVDSVHEKMKKLLGQAGTHPR